MKVHQLELTPLKDRKRVGRGIGSGYGKTAGRGTKGQNARSGGGVRPGFEGGQNPLAKRLPKKRGFTALNPTNYQTFNLAQLERFSAGTKLDAAALKAAGLVKRSDRPVKLLGGGRLTKKLTLAVQAASQSAIAAVEQAGGSVQLVPPARPRVQAARSGRGEASSSNNAKTKP
ncbi:50S ribosomal protein L15 [Candidatus Parcubacteria bacterium]|nr:50S ribosomal protein L15 [Candidatus Parcubacteria bacterium]